MLSVILVTYNSAGFLGECLRSLEGRAEIIIVDNASSDNSVELARQAGAKVLANSANRGFAAAANQGAGAAGHDLLLFLNPDTVLLEGLDALEASLRGRRELGAASGLLVDKGGRPQRGFSIRRLPTFLSLSFEVLGLNRVWPGNPVNRRYRYLDLRLDLGLDESVDVEQPAGACLLVKKSVWEQLGGFDERYYPLWFEDVDLCLRLREKGLGILLEPRCRFRHHGGHSLESVAFEERQLFWYRNLLYYVEKNWGYAAAPAMRAVVCAGACARMLVALLRGKWSRIGAFRAIISLALGRKNRQSFLPVAR